ncbi:MAG: two-component sensor histidine kinase, partial [Ginsengibacter sp.]
MFFLQSSGSSLGISNILIFGTIGMFVMAITLVSVVVFHQRRVIRFNKTLQKMEEEKQQMLLKASINFQEEE